MHLVHIILLLGMSLLIGVPVWIWTAIPKWIVVIASPILAIISINLIDQIVILLERGITRSENLEETVEERKERIFREAHEEISRQFDTKRPCPKCGSTNVALILYGLMDLDEKMKAMTNEGKITLGGCMAEEKPLKWACNDCRHKYGIWE